MSPLVRATVVLAVLSALASAVHREIRPKTLAQRASGDRPAGEQDAAPLPCPPGLLPDNRTCIPVPERSDELEPRAKAWQVYDRLPRRPDRPAEYERYLLPLDTVDLVQKSSLGPSGEGLLLMGGQGAPVLLRVLAGQLGDTTVAFSGELVGRTVVTKHHVREGAREHDYLVVHGNLARIETKAGLVLKPGARLGTIGSAAAGHSLGLHLEVRRVRHGLDTDALLPASYLSRAHTIVADPRNVFETRE